MMLAEFVFLIHDQLLIKHAAHSSPPNYAVPIGTYSHGHTKMAKTTENRPFYISHSGQTTRHLSKCFFQRLIYFCFSPHNGIYVDTQCSSQVHIPVQLRAWSFLQTMADVTGLSSHFAIAARLVAALTSLATTAAFC